MASLVLFSCFSFYYNNSKSFSVRDHLILCPARILRGIRKFSIMEKMKLCYHRGTDCDQSALYEQGPQCLANLNSSEYFLVLLKVAWSLDRNIYDYCRPITFCQWKNCFFLWNPDDAIPCITPINSDDDGARMFV